MNIKIINCNSNLLMGQVGSFNALYDKIANKLSFTNVEYDFTSNSILITVSDEIAEEIPDLSEFGEVVLNVDFGQ